MIKKLLLISAIHLLLFSIIGCESTPKKKVPLSIEQKIVKLANEGKKGNQNSVNKLANILGKNQNSEVRALAAQKIGEYGLKGANKQLLNSLEMDDDTVRKEVVLSLGKVRVESNFKKVLAVWKNLKEKNILRNRALQSLGYFKQKAAINTIVKAIKEYSYNRTRKRIAILALGTSKTRAGAQQLIKLLKKEKSNYTIAEALVIAKQQSSYDQIRKFLNKRLYYNELDSNFKTLVTLLANEKYKKAIPTFAHAFLQSNNSELKKTLLETFKEMNLNNSYVTPTVTKLNLRARPNTRAKITGSLNARKIATVMIKSPIKHKIDGKHDFWYKVKTGGNKIGWLFGGYLKILNHKNIDNIEVD